MPVKPIVDELFEIESRTLIISACETCGARAFPKRRRCAACGSTQLKVEASPQTGQVYSWTVIRELGGARADFVPYLVAQVDLLPGLRVQGLVDADPSSVSAGQNVEISFMKVPGMASEDVTYCFVPAKESNQ